MSALLWTEEVAIKQRQYRQHQLLIYSGSIILIVIIIGGLVWTVRSSSLLISARQVLSTNLLATGWDYLAGVSPQSDGLHVSYSDRAIVQQDGTPGQLNPAVNLFGTHLLASQDFRLSATIRELKGTAHLTLYASPPIIQDEFRIEPRSISFQLTGTILTVTQSGTYTHQNVYRQTATTIASTSFSPSDTISIEQRGPTLHLFINNHQFATTTSPFTHTIWFGLTADTASSSWKLTRLQAQAISGTVQAIDTATLAPAPPATSGSLQRLAVAKRPGFLIGAALALGPLVSDSQYAHLALSNFGSMTPENAMKWQFIHPSPTVYDFKEADALVAIAQKNNIAVHGHTLVFGEANPAWVQHLPLTTTTDKTHVRQVMVDHITQVVSHFKATVSSWDVVNEPLADDDNTTAPLRQHIWEKAMGENYIAIAFAAAHQANPQAKLYINEYGLEADGDRWDNFIHLVTQLKSQGVPVDGVGMEAHVYESDDAIDPTVLRAHIRQLADLGLTTRISEMDVYSDDGTAVQAKQYANVLRACIREPSCVSWSTWGVMNRYDMYQDDNHQMQYGQDLLWNADATPTPALGSLQAILQ